MLVMQCKAGEVVLDNCEAATVQPATLDNEGTFSTTVAVRRNIVAGGDRVDCAVSKCEIVAVDEGPLFGFTISGASWRAV